MIKRKEKEKDIKEPVVAPFKMDIKELKNLLSKNLKKQRYKYLYEIKNNKDSRKIIYEKSCFENGHLVKGKLIIFEAQEYSQELETIIQKEIKKYQRYNEELKTYSKDSIQIIVIVNKCNISLNDFYASEYIYSLPLNLHSVYTPFIIDANNKRVLISGNKECKLSSFDFQINKLKRLFKGIY